jgi:hypothetical protein
MRWLFRSLVVLALAWVVFILSPYVAFYKLAKAVQAKDVAAITERVNFSAVRISLSRQIASAYAKATGGGKQESSPVGQVAVSAGTAAIDPLIAPYLTPQAIIDLLTTGAPDAAPKGVPDAAPPSSLGGGLQPFELSLDRFKELFFASESRGFRGFAVALPPGQPPEERFRLIFRLTGPSRGFTWRLVGLELPARLRDRLVQQFVKT